MKYLIKMVSCDEPGSARVLLFCLKLSIAPFSGLAASRTVRNGTLLSPAMIMTCSAGNMGLCCS